MNWLDVWAWGFVATALQTTLMAGAQRLGLSRISLPFMLGTMVTANRDRASVVGFILHLCVGWLIAAFYALVFIRLGRANPWLGGTLGIAHALFILLAVMPILPGLHPRMASEHSGPEVTRGLEPPGFLALNYGRWTPLVVLIAHAVYGAVLGVLYRV